MPSERQCKNVQQGIQKKTVFEWQHVMYYCWDMCMLPSALHGKHERNMHSQLPTLPEALRGVDLASQLSLVDILQSPSQVSPTRNAFLSYIVLLLQPS